MTTLAPAPTILRRVRQYLELHRRATLGDLALHFDVPPAAMTGMLDTWLRKGRVRQLDVRAACNTSCATACDDDAMTIFEWVEAPGPAAPARSFAPLPVLQPLGDGGGCCRRRA